jgi:glycosyltransferase involved in cell wall biosynthesis
MKIFCAVTNDLSYDQRMIRICTSLAGAGHEVVLVGRRLKNSVPLIPQPFGQKRLSCIFNKGKLFYAEYNIRLLLYLLFTKMDCICAVDLDTILPCFLASKQKKIPRVYDAHELFCEMKEIVSRPAVYRFWKKIEQFAVPRFANGYTVNEPIAAIFNKEYGVHYQVIKNVPMLESQPPAMPADKKTLLYQGAVNEGRCFETLIPAMQNVNATLLIYGEGNFLQQAKQLAQQYQLTDKVIFKGNVSPAQLKAITPSAYIGINLVENNGLSNYLSLANKFFDYMHAGVPQLCVNYPAYTAINQPLPVALLTADMSAENIALQLNNLLHNEVLYQTLKTNCLQAKQLYHWQLEEKTLIPFYQKLAAPKHTILPAAVQEMIK